MSNPAPVEAPKKELDHNAIRDIIVNSKIEPAYKALATQLMKVIGYIEPPVRIPQIGEVWHINAASKSAIYQIIQSPNAVHNLGLLSLSEEVQTHFNFCDKASWNESFQSGKYTGIFKAENLEKYLETITKKS